jgi:uncharacterized protein DUF4190
MTYSPPPEPPGSGPPQPGNGPQQSGYDPAHPEYGTPQPGYGAPPPDPVPPPIQAYQVPPGYAVPGQPPPVQAYQPYAYGYGYQQQPPTEGLAIASLVLSCAAVLGICTYGVGGLLGVAGAILGHVARRRIARNGTRGAGQALAGIIVGWSLFGLCLLLAGAIIAVAITDNSS